MRRKTYNALLALLAMCMVWNSSDFRIDADAVAEQETEEVDADEAYKSITILKKETSYDVDGNVLSSIDYSYDNFGNLLTETHSIDYVSSGFTYVYDYDSRGNLVKESYFEQGSLTSWTEYSNDSYGNVSEGICYRINSDGNYEMYRKVIYSNTYDSAGRLLNVLGYAMDMDGDMFYNLIWEKYITYDENGNVLTLSTQNISDNYTSTTVYEYSYNSSGILLGENSNWINEDGEATDSSYSTFEYKYDSDGNILSRESYDEEGNYDGCLEYSYEKILVESGQSGGSESDVVDQNYAKTEETETVDEVERVLESAKGYAEAEERDYPSAIQTLQTAIEAGQDDEKGQLQTALEKYQTKYAEQIENEVSALIGNMEYDSARQTLLDTEEYLAGIETFENTKVWTEAMIEAKIAYTNGDYKTAISLLQDAVDTLGGNSQLESALTACKSDYKNYLTMQINAYVTEGTEAALNSADTLLMTAEELMAGDTTVIELKSTVAKAWEILQSYSAAGVEFLTYNDSLSNEDQVNSYTITPAVSGTYRIDFSGMVSGYKIRCNIYNSLNERVGGTGTGAYETTHNGKGVTISLTGGETYRIDVKQYSGTGEYTMTIGQKKTAVTIDDYSTIYDMIEFEDQNISYKFTPTVTGSYRFDFNEMVNDFEIELNVYNSLNEKVGGTGTYNTTGNGDGVTVSLTAGETYKLNVVQSSGMGSYTMHIGKQKETRTISAGSVLTDEITFKDQQINYEFTAETSGTFQFSLTGMDSSFSTRVYIYDDLGYEVANGILQNSSFTAELIAGDTYKIVVNQYNGLNSMGSYVLSVN